MADLKYSDYENLYPDTVIIRKEGAFYTVRGQGAVICYHFFHYKCRRYDNGSIATGFLENGLESVSKGLSNESISYMVIVNGEVVAGENFGDNNRFSEFKNSDTRDIPYSEFRKKTGKNEKMNDEGSIKSVLSEEEKKLCDISIKYMERMISGHHPVNNSDLDDDTVVSNENVQKCFRFVLDILKRVSSVPEKTTEKIEPVVKAFELKPDYEDAIEQSIRDEEVKMSQMESLMNNCADKMFEVKPYKISTTRLSNWLVDNGYLVSVEDEKGNRHREASDKGKSIGMTNNLVKYDNNYSYIQYTFSARAQRFILERLAEIANHKRKKE